MARRSLDVEGAAGGPSLSDLKKASIWGIGGIWFTAAFGSDVQPAGNNSARNSDNRNMLRMADLRRSWSTQVCLDNAKSDPGCSAHVRLRSLPARCCLGGQISLR